MRLCLTALLLAATGWRGAAEALLIRNATVLTITKGTIQDGSVLVENGKIAEEIGLDDGVTALQQLGILKAA